MVITAVMTIISKVKNTTDDISIHVGHMRAHDLSHCSYLDLDYYGANAVCPIQTEESMRKKPISLMVII